VLVGVDTSVRLPPLMMSRTSSSPKTWKRPIALTAPLARDQNVGLAAKLFHALLARLAPDHALKVTNHRRCVPAAEPRMVCVRHW
jgi:hypothetical protein